MSFSTRADVVEFIKLRGPSTPAALAKEFGISPQAMHRHLARLCRDGALRRIGSPPTTRYEIGTGSTQPPRESAPSEVRAALGEILGAHPAVSLATLFGSFARGTARADSDIDVLVWLAPRDPCHRRDLWDYWDRQSRHLAWGKKVSLVVARLSPCIQINTLLLDLPEEHIPVFDRANWFASLRRAVVAWREKNGAEKLPSFGGKHGWRYSTKAKSLSDIDFTLRLDDVA